MDLSCVENPAGTSLPSEQCPYFEHSIAVLESRDPVLLVGHGSSCRTGLGKARIRTKSQGIFGVRESQDANAVGVNLGRSGSTSHHAMPQRQRREILRQRLQPLLKIAERQHCTIRGQHVLFVAGDVCTPGGGLGPGCLDARMVHTTFTVSLACHMFCKWHRRQDIGRPTPTESSRLHCKHGRVSLACTAAAKGNEVWTETRRDGCPHVPRRSPASEVE